MSQSELDPAAARRITRMQRIMAARSLTAAQWAQAAGLARSTIYAILSGRIAQPSTQTWSDLARAAGTTVEYLRDGRLPMFTGGTPDGVLDLRTLAPSLAALDALRGISEETRTEIMHRLLEDARRADLDETAWLAKLAALVTEYTQRR